MGLDSSGISAKSHEAHSIGEQTGHFFTHGMKRAFHAFTIGGILRETLSFAKEYESVKDDAEKLKEAFGNLTESQKNAFESIAHSSHKAEIAVKQGMAAIIGSIADAGELIGTMIFAGVGPNKAAEMMVKERAEAAADAATELKEHERAAFAEWVKDHITRKHMTREEQIMYLNEKMSKKADQAYEEENEKKKWELQREAATIKEEILSIEKEITDEHEKQLEKQRKLDEAEAKRFTRLLRDHQHALKNLQDAQALDKPGVGDIDPSGAGSWQHIPGRSGLGSSRFVPRTLTAEDIRIRDRNEKIAELKDAAQHTSDMLDKFYNEGFQIKADD